jgi:threonine aldolase
LWAEEYGFSSLAGLSARTIATNRGVIDAADASAAILTHSFDHRPQTGLVWLENTHNAHGGTVMLPTEIEAVAETARSHGVPVHLDGARLANAAVALQTALSSFCAHVDSVTLNLNKGLSAPAGALLCGTGAFIEACRPLLRRIGCASIHQAGLLAAAGLVALETMMPQIAIDHDVAQLLACTLEDRFGQGLQVQSPETNIILVRRRGPEKSARTLRAKLRQNSVLVSVRDDDFVRLVTHRHVAKGDISHVANAFSAALSS